MLAHAIMPLGVLYAGPLPPLHARTAPLTAAPAPALPLSPSPPQPDALFVIVPALALPTKLAAAAYILMFVLGTVAAMGAYTGIIGELLLLGLGRFVVACLAYPSPAC